MTERSVSSSALSVPSPSVSPKSGRLSPLKAPPSTPSPTPPKSTVTESEPVTRTVSTPSFCKSCKLVLSVGLLLLTSTLSSSAYEVPNAAKSKASSSVILTVFLIFKVNTTGSSSMPASSTARRPVESST